MYLRTSIYIISGKNPLTARSGYASYSHYLAKLLTSLGYRLEIFCLGAKDEVVESQIGTIHIIGSKLYSTILKDREMAGLLVFAPKLFLAIKRRFKPDFPIIVWGIGPWSLAGCLLKIFHGKKIIFFADYFTTIKHEFLGTLSGITLRDHGLWNKIKVWITHFTMIQLYTLLEYFLLKFSDKVITHYNSTEVILTSQFGILSKKYVRLPYHVELLKRQLPSDSNPTPYTLHPTPLILLVCRHDGRKGINYLLHAFSILNDRGVKYSAAIIGEGSLFKAQKQLAKKLNLSNISLLGFIPNLNPFFKKASLFVFPSLEEGSSSLAILEAMKEGLPIVSTNVDGIPEDLEDGKSALLVPPKDPKALADAMQRLLQNHTLAKKLAQNAKKDYLKKHHPDMVKREVDKFLNSLVKRPYQQ